MAYVKSLKVVYGRKPDNCVEPVFGSNIDKIKNLNPDEYLNLNKDLGGESAYIQVEKTDKPEQAIYGVDVLVQQKGEWNLVDYNMRTNRNTYRHYLKGFNKPREKFMHKIVNVAFGRFHCAQARGEVTNLDENEMTPPHDIGGRWDADWQPSKTKIGRWLYDSFTGNDNAFQGWKWNTAKHSPDLNIQRGGDVLLLFLEYEGQPRGVPNELNEQDVPRPKFDATVIKRSGAGYKADGKPQNVGLEFIYNNELSMPIKDMSKATDYKNRLYSLYTINPVYQWLIEVKEGRVSDGTKQKWTEINEKKNGTAEVKSSNVKWDTEKMCREAVRDGWW